MKRIAKWGALILCSLFIITIFGCRDDDDSDNHLTGYEYTDEDINPLSDIEKLPRMTANNTLDIRFIVMGDPHVEADLHQCFFRQLRRLLENQQPLCVSEKCQRTCK